MGQAALKVPSAPAVTIALPPFRQRAEARISVPSQVIAQPEAGQVSWRTTRNGDAGAAAARAA